MGIKNDLQKKKEYSMREKKHLKKYNKNTRVKVWINILSLSLYVGIIYSKSFIQGVQCDVKWSIYIYGAENFLKPDFFS